MSETKELVITVPAEMTRRCKGLALDMGGSMLKFVYRSKEDFEEVADESVKHGHLRLVSFPSREIQLALDHVRKNAHITRDESGTTVYTTGHGCTKYGKTISEALDVKMEVVPEFDCFAKSFIYLASRLSRAELLETFLENATVEPVNYMKGQLNIMKEAMEKNLTSCISFDANKKLANIDRAVQQMNPATLEAEVPLTEADPDLFPCLIPMCGSGFAFIKVNKDGSYSMIDGSNRGGQSLYGMGSLISGCKTFEEFMDLASKGSTRDVDVFTDEVFDPSNASEGDEGVYQISSKTDYPGLVFCFGKAIGRGLDKFRREDLARAWLNYIILDLVQTTQYICVIQGIKRVFFSGGICSFPLVREIITKEFVNRKLFQMTFSEDKPHIMQFGFLKAGHHLGALGCMVNDVEHFVGAK